MTQRFYFRRLDVRNYRALKELSIPKLKRINVIGGLNGVGKTAVLEALFMSLNVGEATRVLRPLQTRGIPVTAEVVRNLLFTNGDTTRDISVRAETRDGTLGLTVKSEATALELKLNTNAQQGQSSGQISQPIAEAITVTSRLDEAEFDVSHLFDVSQPNLPPGMGFNKSKTIPTRLPICAFIDKGSIFSHIELAQRYTKVVQGGYKRLIVELARTILPECKDVSLLHIGGISQVCGELETGQFLPISLLGDGASIVLSIGLALLSLQDGILLLDEFDTALHFSKLMPVWRQIATLADQVNCQIIAVTHSRECIEAAAAALSGSSFQSDFQFMRIDRVRKKIAVTGYDVDDLNVAFAESWEVR